MKIRYTIHSLLMVAFSTVMLAETRLPVSTITPMTNSGDFNKKEIVWDAWNGNRKQNSGPIFYVNKEEGRQCEVEVFFKSNGFLPKRLGKGGQLADGLPPNFVLRIFDPGDHSILTQQLGQKVAGWYRLGVDLNDMPTGRYRFAFVGWFDQLVLKTKPNQPVGVIGGETLGLYAVGEKYLYVPKDVSSFVIEAGTSAKNQRVSVYDEKEKLVDEKEIEKGSWSTFTKISLNVERPGAVWKIKFAGDEQIRLNVKGLPGLLWPDRSSAERSRGDAVWSGERRLAHQWQKTLADWLKSRKKEDFVVKTQGMKKVDFDALPDSQIRKLNGYCAWNNMFSTGRSLIKHNQITDPESPYLGLFVDDLGKDAKLNLDADDDNVFGQVGYALNLANLYASPMDGLNAYYLDPGLRDRAFAAAIQVLLCVPEKQFTNMDFAQLRILGRLGYLLVPHMDPELAEAFKAGLLEFMCRNAYFDGYQSNQGLNVIVGLKTCNTILKDPELERWYERYMNAFFSNQFKDWNHGQTPAGFYQESGGLDGAYNTFSASLLMSLMRKTGDPRYRQSLEKNFELMRHLAVTLPNGKFNSARQWNTRTDSNSYRWHNYRAGADIPGCSTILLEGHKTPETLVDLKKTRHTLKTKSWNHMSPQKLDSHKWWGGFGGIDYDLTPEYARPLPLACQEKEDFYRTFGTTYAILKKGPWYAIFYSGDYWTVGACGSGLATLWHQDFGPLILGDTEKGSKVKLEKGEPDGNILILADGWKGERRFNTKKSKGTIAFEPKDDTVSVTLSPLRGGFQFTRSYSFTDETCSSDAINAKNKWLDHDVYLPLVSGPNLKLEALNGEGNPVRLEKGVDTEIKGFRWTVIKRGKDKKHPKTPAETEFETKNAGKTIELTFPRIVRAYPHCVETCGANELTIVRVHVGEGSGKWSISEKCGGGV